jgi:hypothetical protein
MGGDERGPGEAEGIDDVREREDDARRARAGAEGDRAAEEREAELGGDGEGVIPDETDADRSGVMRPPGGGAE